MNKKPENTKPASDGADAVVSVLLGLARMLGGFVKMLFWALKMVFKLVTWKIGTPKGADNQPALAPMAMTTQKSGIVAQEANGLEGDAVMAQKSDFDVADQIISLRLEPAVGVINMRVYNYLGLVRTDLLIHEPKLRSILGGQRRHELKEMRITGAGLDPLKDEAVRLAEKLINEIGNARVKAVRSEVTKPVEVLARPKAESQARQVERTAEAPQRRPSREVEPAQVAAPKTGPRNHTKNVVPENNSGRGEVYRPAVTKNVAFQGRLKAAGNRMQYPHGRAPFETFEAVLELENGVEMPLRGGELERELSSSGCEVGDWIEVTPLGKVPVALPSGKTGAKNLFRVRNLEGATQ